MPPTDTTSTSVPPGCSELDEKIEEALTDYTRRVHDERPYEDTVGADDLRHRYNKK